MKQQEQAAYQALMSNPLRLRELQERNGIKPKKDKKEKKKEKKERKEKERARERESRGRGTSSSRPRSASPPDDYRKPRSPARNRYGHDRGMRSPSPYGRRSRSPERDDRRYRDGYRSRRSRSRTPDSYYNHRNDRSRERDTHRIRTLPRSDESEDNNYDERRRRHVRDFHKRRRSSSPANDNSYTKRVRITPPPSRPSESVPSNKPAGGAEERSARLAAMQSNATSMEVDRRKRLLDLLEKEKVELENENRAREKSNGMGGFLSQEQKKVFGGTGGLEDRIRRGRHGLVAEKD